MKRITLDQFGKALGIEVTHIDTPKAQVKEVVTPFGYSVKVGGLSNTGTKTNK